MNPDLKPESDYQPSGKPMTGRKVLYIALAAFGVVITANLALVHFASKNFSGLVAENSYVASQEWAETRAAEDALGWTIDVSAERGEPLRVTVRDAEGGPIDGAVVIGRIGRPTDAATDAPLELTQTALDEWRAPPLETGAWFIKLSISDYDGRTVERAYRRTGPRPPLTQRP